MKILVHVLANFGVKTVSNKKILWKCPRCKRAHSTELFFCTCGFWKAEETSEPVATPENDVIKSVYDGELEYGFE